MAKRVSIVDIKNGYLLANPGQLSIRLSWLIVAILCIMIWYLPGILAGKEVCGFFVKFRFDN